MLKKGQRVKIKGHKLTSYLGQIGVVLDDSIPPYVKLNTGDISIKHEYELTLVEPSIDNLMVGDIIVDKDGYESKVLVVLGDVFLSSIPTDFEETNFWLTKSEAKKLGFTVKGSPIDSPKEYSMDEIAKSLGIKVTDLKIKKE